MSPITPNERGARSAGGAYHHTRSSDLLGSPVPTSRSVYSPDSTSPTVPASRNFLFIYNTDNVAMNGHGGARYQSQEVRPYGQSATAYLPDNRGLLSKINNSGREDTYVAVPLMGEQGGNRLLTSDLYRIANSRYRKRTESSQYDGSPRFTSLISTTRNAFPGSNSKGGQSYESKPFGSLSIPIL